MSAVLRGTIYSFASATWTAVVQLAGSVGEAVMPVLETVANGQLAVGDQVAVLLFDELNPDNGVVLGPFGGAGSSLTSGRVVLASSGGLLTSDADLTFNGSQLAIATQGSGGGILLGGDAQLYRSDADTLRTPDALTVDGNLTAANVLSGTYTPTLTGVANIAATGALTCQYLRVGNVVTVSGAMTIDPTSAGSTTTELGISLPIATDFTAGEQCGGVAINGLSNNQTAAIDADATNNRARMRWLSLDAANRTWAFTFIYQVR